MGAEPFGALRAPSPAVGGSNPARARITLSWGEITPAVSVDVFRVAAGISLLLHYVQHVRLTHSVLGAPTLGHPSRMVALAASALPRLGAHGLELWFAAGALLGGFVALGVAPRLSAVLLLALSATTYEALFPIVTLDDYVAQALSFWLMLLPSGRTLTLRGVRRRHDWGRERVSAWPVWTAVFFAQAFCLSLCIEPVGLPAAAKLGFFLTAAWSIASPGALRWLAVLPAGVSLWYLADGDGTTLASRASAGLCCACLIAAMVRAANGRDPEKAAMPIGIDAAVGFSVIALLVSRALAGHAGGQPIARAAGMVLADVGLAPYQGTLEESSRPGARIAITTEDGSEEGSGDVPIEGFDSSHPRFRLALRLLDESAPRIEGDRGTLVRTLIERHCREKETADPSSAFEVKPVESLRVLRDGGTSRRIATFQCGTSGEAASLLPLAPTGWTGGMTKD